MSTREVWITGIGAITAAGEGVDPMFRALACGQTAVTRLPDLGDRWGARVSNPAPTHATRRLDCTARLFVASAEQAWEDAGLESVELDPRRCGVIEGSSLGPMSELAAALRMRSKGLASPLDMPSALTRYMTGAGSASFATSHGIRGPVMHVSAGSVSAACAIGEAFEKIAAGRLDLAVTGGSECALQEDVVRTFGAVGLLDDGEDGPHPNRPCRPFDRHRNGTVLGEGAGVLILEAEDHARRRGARPRAIVSGAGLACEAHGMTAPHPDGLGISEAASAALVETDRCGVGWIKSHGTGTRPNDAAECRGLAAVFGSSLRDFPLTSFKPVLGHCLGASGAVETVATVLALETGLIPPTLGTKEVDPAIPACTVVQEPTCWNADWVLLLSESFGGRCAALVLRRTPGRLLR